MPLSFLIFSDVVAGSAIQKQYNAQNVLTYAQIDRVFGVQIIGETDPAKYTSDAENYIKTVVPLGTPFYNEPIATARNYQVRGITGSQDTVDVVVSYIFNQVAGDPTTWTIESDSYLEVQDSDNMYDDKNKLVPIAISNYYLGWDDPIKSKTPTNGEAAQPPVYSTLAAFRPLKQWNYTKQIYSRDAALKFDAATVDYVGFVNSTTFSGYPGTSPGGGQNLSCPPGTVICYDAGLTYAPYQGQYLARAVFIYKKPGWYEWARYSNPNLGGVPPNIWRDDPAGAYKANGSLQAKMQPSTDLNLLFTLL